MIWILLRTNPCGNDDRIELNSSREEKTYFFGGVLLHGWGDMAVGVEGEACGVVSEEAGEGFHIHTVLQRHRCEGVAQGMKSDFFQSCPFQNSMEHFEHTVRGYWATCG